MKKPPKNHTYTLKKKEFEKIAITAITKAQIPIIMVLYYRKYQKPNE